MFDSDGNFFNLDAAEQEFAYNSDNTLASITATLGGSVWVQSFSYANGSLANITQWELQ